MSYNYNLPGKNTNRRQTGVDVLLTAKVASAFDETDGGRIQARIKGIDDKVTDEALPYAFPMIPKFFQNKPKVGETVFILRPTTDNDDENRLFVGPVISQPQKLNKDPHFLTSQSTLDTGMVEPAESPSRVPEAKGVYPDPQHVSIQGRGNSDIILKNKEVLLRAGKFVTGNRLKFNEKNPGYLQIRHDFDISKEDNNDQELGTVTNIVSSKINLLTHNGSPNYRLNNREKMIGDNELRKIVNNAQPVVFGNKLIEFIELLQKYIKNHKHPYHGQPPDETEIVRKLMEFDLDSLKSENVRVN